MWIFVAQRCVLNSIHLKKLWCVPVQAQIDSSSSRWTDLLLERTYLLEIDLVLVSTLASVRKTSIKGETLVHRSIQCLLRMVAPRIYSIVSGWQRQIYNESKLYNRDLGLMLDHYRTQLLHFQQKPALDAETPFGCSWTHIDVEHVWRQLRKWHNSESGDNHHGFPQIWFQTTRKYNKIPRANLMVNVKIKQGTRLILRGGACSHRCCPCLISKQDHSEMKAQNIKAAICCYCLGWRTSCLDIFKDSRVQVLYVSTASLPIGDAVCIHTWSANQPVNILVLRTSKPGERNKKPTISLGSIRSNVAYLQFWQFECWARLPYQLFTLVPVTGLAYMASIHTTDILIPGMWQISIVIRFCTNWCFLARDCNYRRLVSFLGHTDVDITNPDWQHPQGIETVWDLHVLPLISSGIAVRGVNFAPASRSGQHHDPTAHIPDRPIASSKCLLR